MPELKRLLTHLLVEHTEKDDEDDGKAAKRVKEVEVSESATTTTAYGDDDSVDDTLHTEKDDEDDGKAAKRVKEVEISESATTTTAHGDDDGVDDNEDNTLGGLSYSSLEGAATFSESSNSASASSLPPRALTCAALADCAGAVHLLIEAGADVEDEVRIEGKW